MKKNSINGALYLSIASVVFLISGYAVNVLLGRFLGPTEYGIYGIVLSLIAFVNIIQTSGITQAVSKHISEKNADSESILKTGLLLQGTLNMICFLFFFIFADVIAQAFNDIELSKYIRISSFVFPIHGFFGLYTDYYNGLHSFKKQANMNILYSVSKVFLILLFAYFFHLTGVFYGFILAPVLPLLIGLHFPKRSTSYFPFRKIFFFSLPLIGIAVFSNLLFSIDLFFVKTMMRSKASPGFYTASQNIAKIVFYSMSALFLVIFPTISESTSSKMQDKTKNIRGDHWNIENWLNWDREKIFNQVWAYYKAENLNSTYNGGCYVISMAFKLINNAEKHSKNVNEHMMNVNTKYDERDWYYCYGIPASVGVSRLGLEVYGTFKKMPPPGKNYKQENEVLNLAAEDELKYIQTKK